MVRDGVKLTVPGYLGAGDDIVKARLGSGVYRVVLATLLLSLFIPPALVGAEGFGPFPVRNFQAFQQLVLSLPGDRAAVVKPGTVDVRLELAETASIYNDNTPPINVTVKFETLRSGLFFRYGATDKLELGLEMPVLYRYQGFMNGGPGAMGLGDTTLMSKYQLLTEGAAMPAVSLRGAVKLPTGDQSAFFGSGSPDFGLGLAVEKLVAGRWILYGNLTGVVPTGTIAGFGLRPTMSGIFAVEYLWSENLSITTHFDYYSSPFSRTGSAVFDQSVTESALGFSYRVAPHFLWQAYAVENLDFITGSAADFTVSTVFTYRFESAESPKS
jgi:Protein of unknown function (DUF3187)